MLSDFITRLQHKPSPTLSVVLFLICTGFMLWARLTLFADSLVNISYGLPLLICLWYPDRRLLWSLMGAFMLMSVCSVILMSSAWLSEEGPLYVWQMQMFNMLVVGLSVHLVIDLMDKLRAQKTELEAVNREMGVREEAITRQNEELAQQAEEVQQQTEELQQQSEELQVQSEELQAANDELGKRQAILEALLQSLRVEEERDLPGHVCQLLVSLLGENASAAVVLEREGDDLVVLAQAGPVGLVSRRWPYGRSFATIVMGEERTACVADLKLRPDLEGAQAVEGAFRSVLATPLRLGGRPAGVVKVYSEHPHAWTREQFKIIEWVSAQCSLMMDSRRLKGELRRANADLDRQVKMRTTELQELVNELEHFSYTITHDLRAPLRAMHGFAGLLAEDYLEALDARGREYLTRITTAASRMDRLITDALSYSQVVRREMPTEVIHVGRLLAGMIDSYPIFQEPKARIEIAEDLPLVRANEAGLTQCFSNLLGNAVKFVAPGTMPVVRITGEHRGDRVRFWCEDNGIGIPRELQSRVFVMFQRLSKNYEGTGIGLALVKKVVERMGGAVGLESEPGRGSRFWIELKSLDFPS